MNYFVIKDGKQEGPHNERLVRELLEKGTYLESDLAVSEGMTQWHPLGEVLGLKFAGGVPPLPPPMAQPVAVQPAAPSVTSMPISAFAPGNNLPQSIVVTDIRMPFGSMVIFILKWTLAAIPAMLILGTIVVLAWGFFFALVAGFFSHLH